MKSNHRIAVVLAILCCVLVAGCRSILIDSNPPGAKILIDNHDTKKITPSVYSPRHFVTGEYKVTVKKEGYSTITPPQNLRVKVSGMEIFLSIVVPPFFFKNLLHNRWKTAWPRRLVFQLQEGIGHPDLPRNEQTAPAETGRNSISTRLQRLEQLKSQGSISEEEYKQKRKSLIDEL